VNGLYSKTLHKYALPSIFLHKDKQTSMKNVKPAEKIENSTITENPTVENLIPLVMPKAQNRHPTKSSSVLQLLECKKVSSLTSKGRKTYYMDRNQRKTISKLENFLRDSKNISRNFKKLTQNQIIEHLELHFNSISLAF
jgi:hypothetical protein